ncbi:hypothetical protein LCGC14_1527820 [marine sediment metagenome]|uniref:Uncharacterized protein n=1 Tax=marine sediment metagenome TaxID=412755 RepID=A0A0F9JHN5_9ZZZZ
MSGLIVPTIIKCITCQGTNLVYWDETHEKVIFKCTHCYNTTPMKLELYEKYLDGL